MYGKFVCTREVEGKKCPIFSYFTCFLALFFLLSITKSLLNISAVRRIKVLDAKITNCLIFMFGKIFFSFITCVISYLKDFFFFAVSYWEFLYFNYLIQDAYFNIFVFILICLSSDFISFFIFRIPISVVVLIFLIFVL